MTIEIFISSAIVSAVITVIGNIINARMTNKSAEKTARDAAANEIEKMQLTWKREDIVSSDEEFAEMAGAVAKFVHSSTIAHTRDAIEKVAAIRSKETGALGVILDELYESIKKGNLQNANNGLTKAIAEKRRLKGGASGGSQPVIKER